MMYSGSGPCSVYHGKAGKEKVHLCRDISYLTYCWLCLTEVNQQGWDSSQRSVLKSSRSVVRYGFESICRTNRQKPPLCLELHGLHCVSIAFLFPSLGSETRRPERQSWTVFCRSYIFTSIIVSAVTLKGGLGVFINKWPQCLEANKDKTRFSFGVTLHADTELSFSVSDWQVSLK